MFNVCAECGLYAADKHVRPLDGSLALAVCPHCGHGHPFRQLPLFMLTGASGAGKTTVCLELASAQSRAEDWAPACVYLEQDILWRDEFAGPANTKVVVIEGVERRTIPPIEVDYVINFCGNRFALKFIVVKDFSFESGLSVWRF